MSVCVGSTLFVLISLELLASVNAPEVWDPLCVLSATMQGIGFAGAGTVLHVGASIKGLTTAAALRTVTAIGAAMGFGMRRLAILGALTMLLVLRGLARLFARHQKGDSSSDWMF